ncbi:MAG: hypothetical protein ABF265_10495 [Polaribacter sp.]
MKNLILITLLLFSLQGFSQSCSEMMDFVTTGNRGSSYSSSLSSDAIDEVTFYKKTIDYKSYYFAVVCFKEKYLGCSEYLYQVGSSTESNYSFNYFNSAGKAFWKYIHPYNENLNCAPDFE